jgi:hypothetical protein
MDCNRLIFRAQWKPGCREEGLRRMNDLSGGVLVSRERGEVMTVTGHSWKDQVFLYVESLSGLLHPDHWFAGLSELLEDWPGEETGYRKWIPMVDVFHFNEPADAEHWRRKAPPERRVGRVAHLKREMMASYIYYHYQLQEERAFPGPKYEIIAMHENLLFGYQEFPGLVEEPVTHKKLSTSGTPVNWADSRMDLHFQPWEDGHLFFKPVDTVFAVY